MVRGYRSPASTIARYTVGGFVTGLIILAMLYVYYKTQTPGESDRLFWDFVVLGFVLLLTLPWSLTGSLLTGANATHVWPWIVLMNCTLAGFALGLMAAALSRHRHG